MEFFLSESQLLLGCSLSSTSCWVSPHHQHVDTGNYCHKCTCFQTSNHDTREDVENHTTIFYILSHPHHRQGILAPVAGLVELFTSVYPFPVGTQEDACSLPFLLRSLVTAGLRLDTPVFFTSSAHVSQFPEARDCRKLQESPFEQDPCAFRWKHSPVFRLVQEFCPFPLVAATRSVIFALNPEIFTSLSLFNMQFHPHSQSVIISFSSSSSKNFLIV